MKRRRSRVALVCAGGGVTGAVYEIGCLRALEELVDRKLNDLDLYVGVSGGAFVASLLASGISVSELFDRTVGRSSSRLGDGAPELFRLDLGGLLKHARGAPRVLRDALRTIVSRDAGNLSDAALSLLELLPPGLLDNSGVRDYLAKVLEQWGQGVSFSNLNRELYVIAVDLDRGTTVAFGEDGLSKVPIPLAVQASTALPGLYRPVRIGDRDFVDGGVKKTAHINKAIQHGADLVICINPIVPVLNDGKSGPLAGPLARRGMNFVLDQAFRIMLHGRMEYGMERYARDYPDVDILLVEPTRDDMHMFAPNIMRMSARRAVAEHGYWSLRGRFLKNREQYQAMFARHGLSLGDPAQLPESAPRAPFRSDIARNLGQSLDRLEKKLTD